MKEEWKENKIRENKGETKEGINEEMIDVMTGEMIEIEEMIADKIEEEIEDNKERKSAEKIEENKDNLRLLIKLNNSKRID